MIEKNFINAKGECTSYYACYLGDWSYDKFFEVCQTTKALPIKGVHPSSKASEEEKFIAWLKLDFRLWKEQTEREYDCRYTTLEEMFNIYARESCFSDMYKDVFNQRPHLEAEFYLYAMGYKDVGGLRFCQPPFTHDVEEAIWSAKEYRKYMHQKYLESVA